MSRRTYQSPASSGVQALPGGDHARVWINYDAGVAPYRTEQREDRAQAPRDPGIVGDVIAQFADPLDELADVFQNAIDAGTPVSAIEIGRTRDLTSVADLVRENFPYLK